MRMNTNKNVSIYVILDILLIPVYFSRNILLSFREECIMGVDCYAHTC